jgi:hypothetical protein
MCSQTDRGATIMVLKSTWTPADAATYMHARAGAGLGQRALLDGRQTTYLSRCRRQSYNKVVTGDHRACITLGQAIGFTTVQKKRVIKVVFHSRSEDHTHALLISLVS